MFSLGKHFVFPRIPKRLASKQNYLARSKLGFFFCDLQCNFLLQVDVKEWINNECVKYMLSRLRLNIRSWPGSLVYIYQKEKCGPTVLISHPQY